MVVNSDQTSFLFGRLTWESIPLHEPILVATFAAVALGGIAVVPVILKLIGTSTGAANSLTLPMPSSG